MADDNPQNPTAADEINKEDPPSAVLQSPNPNPQSAATPQANSPSEVPKTLSPGAAAEQLRLEEEAARRYAEKGKAKMGESSSGTTTTTPVPLPAVAAVGIPVAADSSDEDEKESAKKAQEEYDLQYAAALQAEEYQNNPLMFQNLGFGQDVTQLVNVSVTADPAVSDSSSPDDVFGDDVVPIEVQPIVAISHAEIATYNPDFQMTPDAWRRSLPSTSICLSRTLQEEEVQSTSPRLELSANEASVFVERPEIVHETPPPDLNQELMVFDTNDTLYEMMLNTNYDISEAGNVTAHYSLENDWNRFVQLNNVQAGDMIDVYRARDTRVHPRTYFVIKIRPGNVALSAKTLPRRPSGGGDVGGSSSATVVPDGDGDAIVKSGGDTSQNPGGSSGTTKEEELKDESNRDNKDEKKATIKIEDRSPGKRKMPTARDDDKPDDGSSGAAIKFPKSGS